MIIFVDNKPLKRRKTGEPTFQNAVFEPRIAEYVNQVCEQNEFVVFAYSTETKRLGALMQVKKNNPAVNIVALGVIAAKALDNYGVSFFFLSCGTKGLAKRLKECKNWLRSNKTKRLRAEVE